MVSFNGFDEKVLTFNGTDITEGAPVTVKDNGMVENSANSDEFVGVCSGCVNNSYVTVQVSGYMELKYSGEAPKLGYTALAANGNGGVKSSASGKNVCRVLKVDTENSTVGFIL